MDTQILHYYGNKHELKDVFLEAYRKIGVLSPACREVGVSRSTIYRWIEEDEDFEVALLEATAEAYENNRVQMDKMPTHKQNSFLQHVIIGGL